ncbi:MAG: amidohydrolase family protein [Bacillota bacterium]|jgi:imidazolonepropionase-like amidohydrolase|nr:amidohydrolase family protein [Bacillota bacterium]
MLVLQGMLLIDGSGKEPIENALVVVEEDKIKAVGRVGEIDTSGAAEAIDLTGKTLLPGLIDCHVHICMDPVSDPFASLVKDSDATTTLKAARKALQTLKAGVTTIRDMGGKNHIDLDLRDAIAQGLAQGPRIMASGRLITMTGGHGWMIGREVDGPDEARKGAREEIKAGVDVIKIMATGGVMTPGVEPGSPQLTEEEMRAAVEEAKKAGKITASHAQGLTGIKNAIRAGIDSIEHGIYLDEEACEMMIENNVYLVPTLAAPYWIVTKGREAGIPDYAVSKTEKVIETHNASFRLALKMGVKIAMGTDSGTPFNEHGENTYELKLMVQEGMTPMQAIVAATKNGAELLGLSDQIGTVEAGKQADLLVVDGNPLEDIDAVTRVHLVFKGGKAVS